MFLSIISLFIQSMFSSETVQEFYTAEIHEKINSYIEIYRLAYDSYIHIIVKYNLQCEEHLFKSINNTKNILEGLKVPNIICSMEGTINNGTNAFIMYRAGDVVLSEHKFKSITELKKFTRDILLGLRNLREKGLYVENITKNNIFKEGETFKLFCFGSISSLTPRFSDNSHLLGNLIAPLETKTEEYLSKSSIYSLGKVLKDLYSSLDVEVLKSISAFDRKDFSRFLENLLNNSIDDRYDIDDALMDMWFFSIAPTIPLISQYEDYRYKGNLFDFIKEKNRLIITLHGSGDNITLKSNVNDFFHEVKVFINDVETSTKLLNENYIKFIEDVIYILAMYSKCIRAFNEQEYIDDNATSYIITNPS